LARLVSGQDKVGGHPRLGWALRSKVVSAFAKRLASVFGHDALLRRSGAFMRRVFASPCFWLASPVSSGPGPTDPGYANKGAGLALARRKVGLAHRIGKHGIPGYPDLCLPESSRINEYLRRSQPRRASAAALACKRPFCNASRRCDLGIHTRSPENPASRLAQADTTFDRSSVPDGCAGWSLLPGTTLPQLGRAWQK
jgi:hypothetical protein